MRVGILCCWSSLFAIVTVLPITVGFSPSTMILMTPSSRIQQNYATVRAVIARNMLDPTCASLVAGSVAGVVGSGVSLPLDKLKTVRQLVTSAPKHVDQHNTLGVHALAAVTSLEVAVPWHNNDTMLVLPSPPVPSHHHQRIAPSSVDLIEIAMDIWKREGWQGFFSGCRTVMLGTGIHKAVAFTTNTCMLELLMRSGNNNESPSALALLLAASTAGIVGSFVLAPMDRVKITLQASSGDDYSSELDCFASLIRQDGWTGLMGRGLGATMVREVPSECIYFGLYGFLMSTSIASTLGPFAPMVFGAMSGCASWIPVYPIDTIKTLSQSSSSSKEDVWEITQRLHQERGLGGFYDGISPRLLRAAVAHAITFYFYDLVLSIL